MAALDDALKALEDAVASVVAARDAEVPVKVEDAVRKAVEDVLTSEGWTAPAPADTPADAPSDAPADAPVA